MKSISNYIIEANASGYDAKLYTINEWIHMKHQAHDTTIYCAIGRSDGDRDGYIIRVKLDTRPYNIDVFYLTDSQLDQLYKVATNNYYRPFSFFEEKDKISIYSGSDLIIHKPLKKLDLNNADDTTIKKFKDIYNESKYTISSKRVKNILLRTFDSL